MKKSGFTLVELLAVIVVLAVISAIAFPIVGDIIDNSEEKAYEQQIKTIERAARNWVANNSNLLIEMDSDDNMVNRSCYLYLSDLKDLGYLENEETINPNNDENLDDIMIFIDYGEEMNQYEYNIVDNGNDESGYEHCIDG